VLVLDMALMVLDMALMVVFLFLEFSVLLLFSRR